jgi:hypothetical protein
MDANKIVSQMRVVEEIGPSGQPEHVIAGALAVRDYIVSIETRLAEAERRLAMSPEAIRGYDAGLLERALAAEGIANAGERAKGARDAERDLAAKRMRFIASAINDYLHTGNETNANRLYEAMVLARCNYLPTPQEELDAMVAARAKGQTDGR